MASESPDPDRFPVGAVSCFGCSCGFKAWLMPGATDAEIGAHALSCSDHAVSCAEEFTSVGDASSFSSLLMGVWKERDHLAAELGDHDRADGTGYAYMREKAEIAANECDTRLMAGRGSWRLLLRKQVTRAFAGMDAAELRPALIRVAAIALAWVEAIDRRTAEAGDERG